MTKETLLKYVDAFEYAGEELAKAYEDYATATRIMAKVQAQTVRALFYKDRPTLNDVVKCNAATVVAENRFGKAKEDYDRTWDDMQFAAGKYVNESP